MADLWHERLRDGDTEGGWGLFVDQYRRLLFAAIRHYTTEPDEVMDVFAHVCEQLRADELARLRRYTDNRTPRASFSTWLVVVVRHLTVDWFRERDGRRRPQAAPEFSPTAKLVYQALFIEGRSHREAFELLQERAGKAVPHREYLRAMREVHATVFSTTDESGLIRPKEYPGDALPTPHDQAADADMNLRLEKAMAALDPDVRTAVLLFVVEDMSAADVARTLGWPNAKWVYNTVYRALATIRERLERLGVRGRDE